MAKTRPCTSLQQWVIEDGLWGSIVQAELEPLGASHATLDTVSPFVFFEVVLQSICDASGHFLQDIVLASIPLGDDSNVLPGTGRADIGNT
jgi:hypothetical protein